MAYEYKSIGDIKESLKKLLVYGGEKSDLLMEITMPTLDDDRLDVYDNFLGGEYGYYEDGVKKNIILQGRLFDVPFIYTTVTNTINAICLDTNIIQCGKSTKELDVTLNIICSKANLRLDNATKRKFKELGYKGTRLDIMVALVGDILNNNNLTNKYLGTLTPYRNNPVQSYFPNNDFFGKIMHYTCSDFMTDYSERSINGE